MREQICPKPPCVSPRRCWNYDYCWYYGDAPTMKEGEDDQAQADTEAGAETGRVPQVRLLLPDQDLEPGVLHHPVREGG